MNISFNEKTEVFEYPSFESVDVEDKPEKSMAAEQDLKREASLFKSNSSVGSSGNT